MHINSSFFFLHHNMQNVVRAILRRLCKLYEDAFTGKLHPQLCCVRSLSPSYKRGSLKVTQARTLNIIFCFEIV